LELFYYTCPEVGRCVSVWMASYSRLQSNTNKIWACDIKGDVLLKHLRRKKDGAFSLSGAMG
jgi:hypothetical protein